MGNERPGNTCCPLTREAATVIDETYAIHNSLREISNAKFLSLPNKLAARQYVESMCAYFADCDSKEYDRGGKESAFHARHPRSDKEPPFARPHFYLLHLL